MMDSRYTVRSNRESGEGQYDIALIHEAKTLLDILIELKSAGKNEQADWRTLAESGFAQM